MLNVHSYENPSRGIAVADEKGNTVEILHVSCNIQPDSGYSLNINVFDAEKVAANLPAVQAEIAAFMESAFGRAAALGLPVPPLGGGENA